MLIPLIKIFITLCFLPISVYNQLSESSLDTDQLSLENTKRSLENSGIWKNPADHQNNDKKNNEEDEDQFIRTVPIFGNYSLGYYFVNIYVGVDGQKQSLILDTGSSLTTFPCKGCKKCGKHYNKPYIPITEQFFKSVGCKQKDFGWKCSSCERSGKCPFRQGYVEGSSYHGYYYKDFVYFIDEKKTFLAKPDDVRNKYISIFGCTDYETNLFYSQDADGIFGLGLKTNRTGMPPNLIDISTYENRLHGKGISLCYSHDGGYMTIGGLNHHKHLEGAVTQEIPFTNSGQFKVTLQSVLINGSPVKVSKRELNAGQGAFFDSGTTLVHGSRNRIDGFYAGITSFCKDHQGRKCGGLTSISYRKKCYKPKFDKAFKNIDEWLSSFPPLTFKFQNGAKYQWFPIDYFYYEKSSNEWCVGMEYYPGRLILGGIFMRHYDIYFDKVNNKLKFTRSKCNSNDHITTYHQAENSTIPLSSASVKSSGKRPPVVHPEPVPEESHPGSGFTFLMYLMMIGIVVCVVYRCVFVNRYKKKENFDRYDTDDRIDDMNELEQSQETNDKIDFGLEEPEKEAF